MPHLMICTCIFLMALQPLFSSFSRLFEGAQMCLLETLSRAIASATSRLFAATALQNICIINLARCQFCFLPSYLFLDDSLFLLQLSPDGLAVACSRWGYIALCAPRTSLPSKVFLVPVLIVEIASRCSRCVRLKLLQLG